MKVSCNQQVAILLATYNGVKYLHEQIDSIINQTFVDWHLYIHDDGSNDNTLAIAKDYAAKIPEKITVLDYPAQGGACNNFFSLVETVEAPYYMFCDQDDIWHDTKVEKCLEAIKREEEKISGLPYLSYCNLRIVDEMCNVIHDDFWDTCQLYPEMYETLNHRVSFTIPGCTMMINHRAKEISGNHSAAFMHDGWFTIRTLAEKGKLIAVPEALMDYRQHSTNTVGVESCYKNKSILYKIQNLHFLIETHIKTYKMLHAAGYGSIATYLYNKVRENVVRKSIYKQKSKR